MKKSILISAIALATFGLTAFTYINWNKPAKSKSDLPVCRTDVYKNYPLNQFQIPEDPQIFYHIDSRFGTTITKEKLCNAKSVIDIVPKKANWSSFPIQSVEVTVLHGDAETSETGKSRELNPAQLKLLKTADYSGNFRIVATCKGKHQSVSDSYQYDLCYYLTVVPEKEAEYVDGRDALIGYLKQGSREKMAIVKKGKLRPGKLSFTVTKEGAITKVNLEESSGYSEVDKTMIDLINRMPGKWTPATNTKAEKVNQEFVFFFGTEGC